MSKGNTTETDILKVIFLSNYDPAWRTNANVYLALHTADPGEAGDQTSNETSYTNYLRVAITKDAAGFTVSGNSAVNAALIQFAQCGVTGATITHFSLGTLSTGAGQILVSGELNSPLPVANLIVPQFAPGTLTFTED